jgi:hypothetical protein
MDETSLRALQISAESAAQGSPARKGWVTAKYENTDPRRCGTLLLNASATLNLHE